MQQPEDLSILLEWNGFALDGARDGHLGLGFDLALQAVTTHGRSPDDVDRWIMSASEGDSILPSESERFFRLKRHVVDGKVVVDPGFAIIVIEDSDVKLKTAAGDSRRARLRSATITLTPRGRSDLDRGRGHAAHLSPAAPLTRRTSR